MTGAFEFIPKGSLNWANLDGRLLKRTTTGLLFLEKNRLAYSEFKGEQFGAKVNV
jgi:hypothetical protein